MIDVLLEDRNITAAHPFNVKTHTIHRSKAQAFCLNDLEFARKDYPLSKNTAKYTEAPTGESWSPKGHRGLNPVPPNDIKDSLPSQDPGAYSLDRGVFPVSPR